MAFEVSKTCAVKIAAALSASVQEGVTTDTPAKLIIYSGAIPDNPDVAVSEGQLATFNLANPVFSDAVFANNGGYIALNNVPPVQASATGTASFFRMLDGTGKAVCQGTVTNTEGNGDVKVSSTSIIMGIDVTIVSYTMTYPAYIN